ncbi:hypothetical protein BC835DRAFT_1293861 [Cytidiella melzeri]|nr:hypothetical protein BC835DRAFT_1293861 [Cytidiella melzeri]
MSHLDSDLLKHFHKLALEPKFAAKILTNDLIYDLIFDNASPRSLLLLSRTCKTALTAVRDYLSRALNINKHLSRYFDDPLAFRCLQARTACLVSGSTALQFFNRVRYPESDLDVYVPLVHHKEVGRWLLEQGYIFQPNSAQDADFEVAALDEREARETVGAYPNDYAMKGVSAVFTFAKSSSQGEHDLQVQVIVASRSPMEVILYFHSTVVMNVISWDRAYCLYPRATLEDRTSLLVRRYGVLIRNIVTKYTARGWAFIYSCPASRRKDLALTFVPRWIGDGRSWVIKLPTEGVTAPPSFNSISRPLTRDPCCLTSWRLLPRDEDEDPYPMVDFGVTVSSNAFFYQYTTLIHHAALKPFRDTYTQWVNDRELSKSPDGLLP